MKNSSQKDIRLAIALLSLGLVFGLWGCNQTAGRQELSASSNSTNSSADVGEASASSPKVAASPVTSSPEDQAAAGNLRQRALDYRNQGRYEEAIATLEKSVELDPNNLSGQVILGWTLHLAERDLEAAQHLEQVIIKHPTDVQALNALGIVYLFSGEVDQAIETHQKAVALQSDNEIGYFNLSLAYQQLGRYEEAIANAYQATQLEPGNPHPWIALAIARWSKGATNLAQDAYQQAINIEAGFRSGVMPERLQRAAFSSEQIELAETIRQSI